MTDAFHHEPRKYLTDMQTAKLFLEQGGRCWCCGEPIGPTLLRRKYTVGHKLALELGGSNEWDNLAIECELCKPIVDAKDHKAAAHMKRAATLHVVPNSMRRKSRLSNSKWRKKCNGETVPK